MHFQGKKLFNQTKISQMPSRKTQNQDESFQIQSESEDSAVGNYTVISYKDRIRLIQMVCLEKQQILNAASSLGIKISTAKYILRCFRKQGKILKKSCDPREQKTQFQEQINTLKQKIAALSKEKHKKRQNTKKIPKDAPLIIPCDSQKKKQNQTLKIEQFKAQQPITKSCQNQFLPPFAFNQSMIYYYFYNPVLY